MSSIKTTQIDGDIAVGRNVTMGGKLEVAGSATIGHNLKVDGWLEAVNIKGANKGIFLTVEELRVAYPNPHDGWMAGVGSSTPFAAYVGKGGDWVATGGTIEVTVDMSQYTEGVEQLQTDIDAVKADVKADEVTLSSHTAQLTNLSTQMTAVSKTATAAEEQAATNKDAIATNASGIASNAASIEALQQNIAAVATTATAADTLSKANETALSKATARIDSLNTVAGATQPFYRMEIEMGAVGSDLSAKEGETYPDGTEDVRTKKSITLPSGTYTVYVDGAQGDVHVYFSDGTAEGQCLHNVASPFTFTVSGTKHQMEAEGAAEGAGNVMRLSYVRTALKEYTRENAAKLYATASNMLLLSDELKSERSDVEALQATVAEQGERIEAAENGIENQAADNSAHHTVLFGGVLSDAITVEEGGTAGTITASDVYYSETAKCFVAKVSGKYYGKWKGSSAYQDGTTPYAAKPYVTGGSLYMYDAASGELKQVGGSSTSSIFNVTNEVPVSGYYTLCDTANTNISAVHAAWKAKKAVSGLILSFEIGAGIWKTYQFIGKTVTENNWYNTENWQDFGSLAAGSETYIVIDELIDEKPVGGYTLATAVQALQNYQATTGVTYAKEGLIISYHTSEYEMETKQFCGLVTDFGDNNLWKDFGGSTQVVASDTPEKGGTDALSTGGAYEALPSNLVVTEDGGAVKLKMVNAEGTDIGDEIQFSVGTGTGGGEGTVVVCAFEESPLYGKAGGEFIARAAIMSTTKAGSQETLNAIESVNFVDRTTKNTVAYFNPKKASSSSLTSYTFEFDLSDLCLKAGEQSLQAVITDDGGHTATKNFSLIAVDVTCESVQTLNYTKDTSLKVGGVKTSIPLYKFPNNASSKGIRVVVEIQKDGEWETLQDAVINDTRSHSVTFDPTGLSHGAYPVRIQGTDVASGTKGNVLHTAVMVIEQREDLASYSKPIVVARWSDDSEGEKKLFEDIQIDVACYSTVASSNTVTVTCEDTTKGTTETLSESTMYRNATYTITKRIVGYTDGDELVFDATAADVSLVEKRNVKVNGSLLDIEETEGAYYKFSMEGRSNTDTDKSIKTTASDGEELQIVVNDANYTTNGFVADNFGTAATSGRMALRVAENVTAECTDTPFASTSISQNGVALSFTLKVKNIAERNAHIIKCMGERLGFVLTGEKFIVTTAGDSEEALQNIETTAATSYQDDTVYRFDIVIEPASQAPYSGVQLCKIYQNGDMSACVPIDVSAAFPAFNDTIHFDGTDADLYLYEVTRWNTYYDFIQAFNNYIVNLTDTQAMLTEYEQNQVMKSVTAEGVTRMRPDMQSLLDRGVMICVETRTATANISGYTTDSEVYYPDYIEDIGDKKTTVTMDLYLYFPDRPWANCKVEAVPGTNQGTSTLAYPLKNKKFKFKKAKGITMLYSREEVAEMYDNDEAILAKYDDAVKRAKKNYIRVKDGSTPIRTITVKVDYSDSAGANNCALMQLMNETQIKLGSNYKTPAQNYNTDSTEELHTSVDGITCALYRTDYAMGQEFGADYGTEPGNAYFHSKANFNADKDNPHFFGFEDVKGYNDGCVNYGDFKEIVTPRGTAIDDYVTTVLSNTASLTPGTLYMISEYCGPETRFVENDGTGAMTETTAVADYTDVDKTGAEIAADSVDNYDWATVYKSSDGKYYQYSGGKWVNTTGTMAYDNASGQWKIVGRVLNPVECYEYRMYDGFCWQQGVNSVDDLLGAEFVAKSKAGTLTDEDTPLWTSYYESRYPDDDDLNELYEKGKKVPYQLYRELAFCQQCNQNLTDNAEENAAKNADGTEVVFNGAGASTTITLDGEEVAGTKENRLLKWQHEMHNYFSPYSTNCYIVASDYKATVDQRAKNMMIAVYLEADGTKRCYFNHWYDGDSVDGADNDCFLTVAWDMDGATSHKYQGWDGVMFRQTYALYDEGKGVWTGNTDSEGNQEQLTLGQTAAAMRSTKTASDQEIFSANGCYRYWMTERILKWPKVVSSFDGQRKYIETATASASRFPALNGLRLESLPAFQRKRFAYRDGYYQTGDLFRSFFQARMTGNSVVKISAAQDGYFALGVDNTSRARYSCFLKEGESYTFPSVSCGEQGTLIYVFGSDKLGELDLSGGTVKANVDLSKSALLRTLILGGENYAPWSEDADQIATLSLDNNPFLEKIDIRNTAIMTLNTSGCPRLKTVLAEGSKLTTFTPAQSSPLATLTLPASMTTLTLENLPNLGYPNGGLQIASLANLTRITLTSCKGITAETLLADVVASGAKLAEVSVSGYNMSGKSTTLTTMKELGVIGVGSSATGVCDGMSGTWMMTDLLEDADFDALRAYYPEMTLINAQYTVIEYDEQEENGADANIRNLDNGTKYGEDAGYIPSGHITKLHSMLHVYKGTYDTTTGKIKLKQFSDSNIQEFADGTSASTADNAGTGYDVFLGFPHYWYKGINDYVNRKKYYVLSTTTEKPLSTATTVLRQKLSELLYKKDANLYTTSYAAGDTFSDELLQNSTANNVYKMNVSGMKQVRWPGFSDSAIGGVFVDKSGTVISTITTNVSDNYGDYMLGEYVFCSVPANAASFIFTANSQNADVECIAVDSAAVEAIEPDWVEHEFELIGVYKASVDSNMRMRSIAGAQPVCGTNTHVTSENWRYDSTTGDVLTTSPIKGTTLNYTNTDRINLARWRGKGYMCTDYEIHKDIANFWMAYYGRRNSQLKCGSGASYSTTGGTDGNGTSPLKESTSGRCRTLGLEDWWGCLYEIMDNVVINVTSYAEYYKLHGATAPSGSTTDAVWHIRMRDGSERAVQGVSGSANIKRMRFGRYCDVVPSALVTDSTSTSYYCDSQWYTASTMRAVLRGGDSASAVCGLVYAYAGFAPSHASSLVGARLAFRGECEFEE